MAAVAGLVLAAGAGTRFGGPKALARRRDGEPWLTRAVGLLGAGGCAPVLVVLGAGADEARRLLPPAVRPVLAADWASGLGASLAAGLRAMPEVDAALITLVDLPDLPLTVVERVLRGLEGEADARPATLRRAVFAGRPGHPVLLGRDHWAPLAASLAGDAGGRAYLDAHGVQPIECGDLGGGTDADTRPSQAPSRSATARTAAS